MHYDYLWWNGLCRVFFQKPKSSWGKRKTESTVTVRGRLHRSDAGARSGPGRRGSG